MQAAFHQRLIQALSRPQFWAGDGQVEVIQTHISSVLLVGDYAYKIKKPVDLGFVDFSTLAKRRHYCLEELRLNRRLAPELYLDVVAIGGTADAPSIEAGGEAIEYAVRMRRFPQRGLLVSDPALVTVSLVEQIARQLARFHGAIPPAPPGSPYGEADAVIAPMLENFIHLRQFLSGPSELARIERLQQWTLAQHKALYLLLKQRKADNMIRECHGDLHLGNMVRVGSALLIFDGIEFNPSLRWIDTISELAFILMDLDTRGLKARASQLLNRYLELTGDYPAVRLLRFYQVYRALVRAKVALICLHQPDLAPSRPAELQQELVAYLDQAEQYTRPSGAGLIITHGFSGAGKSRQSGRWITSLPAIRLRSDVERKRLAGLQASQRSGASLQEGIYSADFTNSLYEYLRTQARAVLEGGFRVIVDATFLRQCQREKFQALAHELWLPFLLVDFQVPPELLRTRIRTRQQARVDPSEADESVLEYQLQTAEALSPAERRASVTVGSGTLPLKQLRLRLAQAQQELAPPSSSAVR